jgi:DNA-binding LacI/PurR family transcriptional regulator
VSVNRIPSPSRVSRAGADGAERQDPTSDQYAPDVPGDIAQRGGSDLFGMIIPDSVNPFFTELVFCFESILTNRNHDLLVASTHFDPQQVESILRRMMRRRVDGIVFIASELLLTQESLQSYKVPVVTMERGEVSERVSDVSVDFDQAMIDAVRYLKQIGHRKIAFISGFPGPKMFRSRIHAFKMGIELAGLELYEGQIQEGDYRAEGGAAAMSRLLSPRIRPTAVIAVNDLTALGALQLLQERGVSVPDQMSVIGFDNIAMSSLVHPQLTTLSISRTGMAQMLYDALIHMRDERVKRGSLYKVRAELLVRGSVASAKAIRSGMR